LAICQRCNNMYLKFEEDFSEDTDESEDMPETDEEE
jgi:hypothetical protein